MSRSLDMVTAVASKLMGATPATAGEVSTQVLAQLTETFDVDACFLRHNDHEIRASVLVAEWPQRPDIPDPDPLAVVYFDGADPVFALCENGKEVVVMGPAQTNEEYQSRVEEARHVPTPSLAAAPLISGEVTTGVLGVIRFADREWNSDDIKTLEAVASLFAQLQARVAAEEKLRYLAEHDDLTGLHNRRALLAYLSDRLTTGRPGPIAVLYLDLDRLKSVNDHLGHIAGDLFIRVFGERLRECAGPTSMVARLGGDEFVVVPEQPLSMAAAETLADQFRTKLRDRLEVGGHMITRSVSIGVAVGAPGRDNSTDLLHRADEAVLRAKRTGGNQVALSTDHVPIRPAVGKDSDNLDLELAGDIDSDALLLHYLPEVDLSTGAIVATEALVRWQHPTRGLLLPDAFIDVAETISIAGELGQWVMRSACADFSRWRAKGIGHNAVLRVNVSPAQLVTRGFVRNVSETIDEFGIDPGSVCLEITERAVVRDIETTRKSLAELKDVGVQIAIDDFGTGYAVLSHLKALPVDLLKIDTGFVRELGTNAGDLAIVRAIIGLADAFGLQLVAEGVETPAAALTLMEHGCHRAQGFLLSRPVTGDAMESLLAMRWIPMPFLADGDALSITAS